MLNKYNTRTVWRSCSPDTQAVTLRSRDPSTAVASYTEYSLYHAQVELIDVGEAPANGVVQGGLKMRHFSLFADDLAQADAPDPKVGDVIVQSADGDSEWLVQRVAQGLLGNEFCCTCQERGL